jgi:hypothetical protein
MPFVLIGLGIILLVSGVRGSHKQLADLLKDDFTGRQNFLVWIVAILGIGAVGYVPSLQPVSRSFLVLVLLVLFINNRGFFTQFQQQILTR